jgi:23S rRNA (uracil1939-C5)-methyltransferase
MRLQIQKLVQGGQGLAYSENGQTVFVWNTLPEEEVVATPIRKKNGIIEAVATEILKPSPHRQPPLEDFYLSTAPWQIMNYDYENTQKALIAAETYHHLGGTANQSLQISSLPQTNGYRNKMEYSFYSDENDLWHIAFFNRGSHRKIPTGVSVLASPVINSVAEHVLELIRAANIPPKTLKSMILRSNNKGEVLFGLFLKQKDIFPGLPISSFSQIPHVRGYKIYYSRPNSPASTTDELLAQDGTDYLETEILGSVFRYGLMSFFQVNEPVFELALTKMHKYLGPKTIVIDYFSGVGAISIGLNSTVDSAIQIESIPEAVEFAKQNIQLNSLSGRYQAHAILAERAGEYIKPESTLILDPPRAGLHADTVQRILTVLPPQIIYMSCNIATHARDLKLLQERYTINDLQIFNFFPQTPHIEGLALLHKQR